MVQPLPRCFSMGESSVQRYSLEPFYLPCQPFSSYFRDTILPMWRYRERLNYYEKLRRSLYEILRDALERRLMKISLIDSFYNYQKNGVEYNFLDKSELKPKSKKMEKESDLFNTFIVIFCEGSVSPMLKNYIRFFRENKVVKKNLEYLANFSLYNRFHHNLRYFDNPGFLDFLEELLDIDYALLIQQDPTLKKKNRYSLTHFHVKIDWPIADAAEDLAKYLRYIQNNLHENGDKQARILQNKLFENYRLSSQCWREAHSRTHCSPAFKETGLHLHNLCLQLRITGDV